MCLILIVVKELILCVGANLFKIVRHIILKRLDHLAKPFYVCLRYADGVIPDILRKVRMKVDMFSKPD